MIYNNCALKQVEFDFIKFDLNLAIHFVLNALLVLKFKGYRYLQLLCGKTTSLDHTQLA